MRTEVEGLDLDALEKVAREATPGPWQLQDGCSWRRVGTRESDGNVLCPTTHHRDHHPDLCAGRGEDVYANLRHITTFDPPTVLRLLAALRAQAERVRVLEGERDLATFVAALISEGCQRFRREAEGRSIDESRWIVRFSAIREASGIGYKPTLAEVPGAIAERIAAAEARAEAAERRAGELEGALSALIVHFEGDELHDEGAFDIECPDCVALEAARALLPATQAENPQEHDDE